MNSHLTKRCSVIPLTGTNFFFQNKCNYLENIQQVYRKNSIEEML